MRRSKARSKSVPGPTTRQNGTSTPNTRMLPCRMAALTLSRSAPARAKLSPKAKRPARTKGALSATLSLRVEVET